jgi:hypothetical protein
MKLPKSSKARLAIAAAMCVVVLGTTAGACDDNTPGSSTKAQNASNNDAGTTFQKFTAAVPYPYKNGMPSDPLERKNLAKRLVQLNSKGSTGYVYLLAGQTGKVMGYYVILGKVSSTSSQMTSTQVNVNCSGLNDSAGQACTNDAIGDDGSFGPDEGGARGVFFFTVNGSLIETTLDWVYSSSPIKLYSSAPQLDAKTN